jgi:hypothetical protein
MQNRTVVVSVLLAAGLLLAVALLQAQQATGTVHGVVRRGGTPVASARVVVDSGSDSKYGASTTTDADGRFTVSDAPVGAVGVKVYDAKGQVIAQGRGTVRNAGDTINVILQVP